jgi:hypothetical protein
MMAQAVGQLMPGPVTPIQRRVSESGMPHMTVADCNFGPLDPIDWQDNQWTD